MNQVTDLDKPHWKKNITLFLSSQAISLFGSALVQYAIMWYITLETQSGVMMTISIICGFLPTFFLSPFAGVWADRYNRRLLIIYADGFIAVSTLILAILFYMGYETLTLLFVMSAIRALGAGIQTPAVGAILPQIVPEKQLTRVNGFNGSIQASIMLLAPIASAGLLTFASMETIFLIDVVTAAIAISIMGFFLKIPAHAKSLDRQQLRYIEDLKLGIRYIRTHPFLKPFFFFFACIFVLVAPAAFLTPLQVVRTFGPDVWRLTAIEIAFSIGMILGGALIAVWGGYKNRTHTMVLTTILMGIFTIGLGAIPIFWLYLGCMALIGLSMPFFNTPATVLLQEKVEESYLGRVFGVLGMISTSMMPLGMLMFGPLADFIAIEWMLVGTGILLVLLGFVLLGNKTLLVAGVPSDEKEINTDSII
ncbi:MFS transporter [Paenisporosarcina cavernae]|uniref:MFS transporter n=1 Tax=Paenisporosarcina cavernae TaxID=2320858 RepID=A0A385YQ61_9BACL|nr:MFS transporter [Paenisporosarcina cavernae]AYC28490.1 MFS transporter [Paenisporosarcina cavernae]